MGIESECFIGKTVPHLAGEILIPQEKLSSFLLVFFKAIILVKLLEKPFTQVYSWSYPTLLSAGSRWEIKSSRCISITELIEGWQKRSDLLSRGGVISS